ncbi:MAG TPA: SpoIID/LytB domain-containing protein, partial [Clostridia bacterium]|nr:SpoIID/LytB domain-containing protein [Clostridia bacterium]
MFRRFLAFIIGIIVSINLMCIQPMHVQGSADKSTIRVLLSSMGSPKQVTINVNGDYGIKDLDNSLLKKGDYTISIASGALVLNDGAKSTSLGSKFTFTRYKGDNPNQLKIGNYNYLGDMEVRLDGGGIRLVNHVHLETYLYGVVPYEVSNTWPIEVQKAQAVAARTYAVGNKKPGSYYDVHDTVADQVYKGYDPKNTNSIKAVNDTFGQVLKYGSGYAHTFYSASNGGTIEASNNLWSGSIPYLVVKADEYDARSTVKTSNTPWKATFKKSPVDPALLKRLKFTDALKAQGLAEAGIENLQIKAFDFKTNTSSRADNVTITLSMDKKPKVEGAP